MTNYVLTDGNDVFPAVGQSNAGNDSIEALAGNDSILAGLGNNTVLGGSGNDTIIGSSASLLLSTTRQFFDGGEGNDLLSDARGANQLDSMYGGAGDDTIQSGGVGGMLAFDPSLDIGTLAADAGDGNDSVRIQVLHFAAIGGSGQDLLDLMVYNVPGALTFDASAAVASIGYDGAATGTATGFENFRISSGAGNDVLTGGQNADTLSSDRGDDILYGGAGNDQLLPGTGNDLVFGGAGDDLVMTLLGSSTGSHVGYGGAGNDTIAGTQGGLHIWGGSGDDLIGVDIVDDVKEGATDRLHGGVGHDRLRLQATKQDTGYDAVALRVVHGVVEATVNGVQCTVAHGFESVEFTASASQVTLEGGQSDDILTIKSGAARVFGRGGDDQIAINIPSEVLDRALLLDGGAGRDVLIVQTNSQPLVLHVQKGLIGSGAMHGTIKGIERFEITGQGGGDILHLGDGNDIVLERANVAGTGENVLDGQGGDDTLTGGLGNDTILGGTGADLLGGGSGDDIITGGQGRDVMSGNRGSDVFVWKALADGGLGDAADQITDFNLQPTHLRYHDVIDLSAIDATGSTSWNAPFKFIGTATFTAEGQIRVEQRGGDALVQFNTSGAVGAEMEIRLIGVQISSLTASDFIL